jgi:hypothetical protein
MLSQTVSISLTTCPKYGYKAISLKEKNLFVMETFVANFYIIFLVTVTVFSIFHRPYIHIVTMFFEQKKNEQ